MAKKRTVREEYLNSVEELMSAISELQITLREAHRSYKKVRTRFDEGASFKEALAAVPTAARRREFTERLEAVESARHRSRVASFALGLSEGMSASEMARTMGFSRQLAAGFAKEAKAWSAQGGRHS